MPDAFALGADDPRADVRSNVFLAATLLANGKSLPVRVRNISSHGALVDGLDLPVEASVVNLRRGALIVGGDIAWRRESHCGIHFSSEVDVEDWVKRVGHTGQQRVDRIVSLLKQPPFQGAASIVLASNEDSLDAICVDLSEVCERLASSPAMLADQAEDLLRLDSIAQRLRRAVEGCEKDG